MRTKNNVTKQYENKALWSDDEWAEWGQELLWRRIQERAERNIDDETIAGWMREVYNCKQVKQLIRCGTLRDWRPSNLPPTHWYTLRSKLILERWHLYLGVEIEQDTPYDDIRIMNIWLYDGFEEDTSRYA